MSAGKNRQNEELSVPDMVLTRLLDAPRELVFSVWTDPAQLREWWGPQGFTNPVCEVSPRSGGAMRIHMRAPDGTVYPMSGTYQEIVTPERIVFKSAALDANGQPLFEVLHTVTFASEGQRTRLTVRARVLTTTAAGVPHLKGSQQGWSQSLDRLSAHLNLKSQSGLVGPNS
jgi:uncharacterized protein YndB with AHSA1/START domain